MGNTMHVIVPAAGAGSRLGLPYPKEIHRIVEGVSLIDFSLGHVLADPHLFEALTVVIVPGKEAVVRYVRGAAPAGVAVNSAVFNDSYTEWAGSILSAEAHFRPRNVVLLPDSRLTVDGSATLARRYTAAFDQGCDVVFAYLPTGDPSALTRLGALRVDGDSVVEFCDKPAPEQASRFNGFWGSFGFVSEAGPALLRLMMDSIARHPVDLGSLGLRVGAFPIDAYEDLGTWPAIRDFQRRASGTHQ